jgi:uncharacterized protein (TIGR03067 family)
MKRFLPLLAVAAMSALLMSGDRSAPAGQPPAAKAGSLDGVWEITALIDDGELVPEATIKGTLVKDARLNFTGQSITFLRPLTDEAKTVLYVTDAAASPATIDLGGTEKVGGKGIYHRAGDSLMICLSGPGILERPADFGSKKGTHAALVTLKRVTGSAPAPVSFPAAPIKGKVSDQDVRRQLVGTWGHQTDKELNYVTFNSDGTFSRTISFKSAFKKAFSEDDRTSGTWKLDDGSIVMSVTAATDKHDRGQVFTYRINSISATDLILIDQAGQVHREWRTAR